MFLLLNYFFNDDGIVFVREIEKERKKGKER